MLRWFGSVVRWWWRRVTAGPEGTPRSGEAGAKRHHQRSAFHAALASCGRSAAASWTRSSCPLIRRKPR
jgi:hypothetical protein